MKYLLLFIFLFIPSVSASEVALSCSYDADGKTINFGYYVTSDGVSVITDFVVDSENYDNFHNYINGTSDGDLNCPTVSVVNFFGDASPHYFITKDQRQFNLLVQSGNIIYDNNQNLLGQVAGIYTSSNNGSTQYTHYSSEEIYASDGLTNEVRKQMNENIKAYGGDICSYHEKQAITNYFYDNDFNSIRTFSADNMFKFDDEYIKLSSDCTEVTQNLYNSIIAIRHMLSDYVDDGGNTNTLNYLSLQSAFYSGYGALTTMWYDIDTKGDICEAISGDIRKILNTFFDIFRTIVVVLTIFMIYIDGMKALTKKDDSETKKWLSSAIKRLVILVICLLLPVIVNLVLDLLNRYMSGSLVEINGECVKVITGG